MVQPEDDDQSIDSSVWLQPDEEVLTEARKARGDTVTTEGERGGSDTKALFENILMFYYLRGHISAAQFRAGNQFHCLWRNSILRIRYVQMRYTELRSEFDPNTLHAVPKEYLDARAAIHGEQARNVVYTVCCEGYRAGKRGEMKLLKAGLDDLIPFFKEKRRLEKEQLDN